jgi:hypothetical protein
MSHCKTKTQKRQQKNRSRSRRQRRRYSRRNQRGGSTILSPSNYSNQNNAHFSGIGFTDPQGAVTGCTGSTSSAAALKGADVFTTIGGVTKSISSMKGGRGRRRGRGRMHRGGSVNNTNGFSIAGVHLKPSLSGIANNYHTAYDSCKG